jgi:hypothetical protein
MIADQPPGGGKSTPTPSTPADQEPLPSGLLTAERIALTVARRHVAAGDAVPAGIAALLAEAVGRLTGTPDDEAAAEVVTEYSIERRSGDRVLRCTEPDVEEVSPLARWLEHMHQRGTTVQTRQVIVVSDWTDVPAAPTTADA